MSRLLQIPLHIYLGIGEPGLGLATSALERRFEVHILNATNDGHKLAGLPEYGWRLAVDIHAWLREQIRYDSLDELIEQLKRDCDRTLEIAGQHTKTPTAQ